MKKVLTIAMCFIFCNCGFSQNKTDKSYRNFPLIVSIQFHSLTLPFKNFGSNFSNVGIGLGTEVSHNGSRNWVQQFNIAWFRNKAVGDGILISTQTTWRPAIIHNVSGEIKAGIGYQYSYRPVESFRSVNGKWTSVNHKGKGMLAIPVGIGAGYNKYSENAFVSPFAGYQLIILKGYSKSIPIVPETVVELGSRIHF